MNYKCVFFPCVHKSEFNVLGSLQDQNEQAEAKADTLLWAVNKLESGAGLRLE